MTEHRCKTRLKKKVDFYTRVVATTPQDRSSRYSIWRYGERTFQHAHCVIFGVFASGRRSRGRRSGFLKVPNVETVGAPNKEAPVRRTYKDAFMEEVRKTAKNAKHIPRL